ncbi:TolC family protein [Desulfofalx alkaliphila]|uniref:TolC family protein n=1 Tax=Desulfofalx alkaliphila TaxID=105483 RepID=UPI00146FA359|nr:TolC family protein [Desulfofalx alkaliphila]
MITVIVFAVSISPTWAKEPVTPELTLQTAIDNAIANAYRLQVAQYEIDRSKEVRDFINDKVLFIPAEPTPNSNAARTFTNLVQADLAWQSSMRDYTATEDSVAMSTIKAYNEVLQAQENVRLAQLNLENKEWVNKMSIISRQIGMVDNLGSVSAQSDYMTAKNQLSATNKALDDAYQKLNNLIGLWPQDRPVLVDHPQLSPLEVDNLESSVNRAVSRSPAVWMAEQNITFNRLNRSLYDVTDPFNTVPYEAVDIEVDKARVTANDIKNQTRLAVRSFYYTAEQLEKQYSSVQEKLRVAEENLRVVKIKNDVGMTTKTDLLNAEFAVEQAKNELLNIICQHQLMAIAFEKPWAYAMQ